MDNNSIFKGAFAGSFAVAVTYPIDTIKTRIQSGKKIYINMSLFKGIFSPLVAVGLEKSALFWSFNMINNKYPNLWSQSNNVNNFCTGLSAGLLTTFIVTPFERIKILAQNQRRDTNLNQIKILTNIVRKEGISALGRGWTATLYREVPGYGFYFATYKYCKNLFGSNYNLATAWLVGGVTGFVPWIFIYPSDVIKTKMQNENAKFLDSYKKIRATSGFKGFYKGYIAGLSRAFFIHSFVILGYELANMTYDI